MEAAGVPKMEGWGAKTKWVTLNEVKNKWQWIGVEETGTIETEGGWACDSGRSWLIVQSVQASGRHKAAGCNNFVDGQSADVN